MHDVHLLIIEQELLTLLNIYLDILVNYQSINKSTVDFIHSSGVGCNYHYSRNHSQHNPLAWVGCNLQLTIHDSRNHFLHYPLGLVATVPCI